MAKRQPERRMGAAVTALSVGLGSPGGGLGQTMYGIPADAPRISFLAVTDIGPNPHQPRKRIDPQAQDELAASIARVGLLQPILVRASGSDGDDGEAKWLIVAGERRWRAVKALGQATIAAVVTGRDPDEAALIENIQRQDLHPVDLARAIARLADRHHYTQEELAIAIGKSQGEVSKLLRILSLPADLLDQAADLAGATRAVLYRLATAEPDQREVLWQDLIAQAEGGQPDEDPVGEPAAGPAPRPPAERKGDAMVKAIVSLGARIGKCQAGDLTEEQRWKLAALRDAIDTLLRDDGIIPQE